MKTALVKIAVAQIQIGMFVSEIDRPIANTPFPMRGFYINSEADIEQVQKYCQFVAIDRAKSAAANVLGSKLLQRSQDQNYAAKQQSNAGVTINRSKSGERTNYGKKTDFAEELTSAIAIHAQLRKNIEATYESLKQQKTLNVAGFSTLAQVVIDSVIRNPDAMSLVAASSESGDDVETAIGAAITAASFGRYLGLPRKELLTLFLGVLFARVGYIRANKTSIQPRTEEQTLISGLSRIQNLRGLEKRSIEVIATQMECENGLGFPKQLTRDEIPMLGKLGAIALFYQNCLMNNPVSHNSSHSYAIAELNKLRGSRFNDALVDKFLKSLGIHPVGSVVELNNKRVALVISQHESSRLKPVLMITGPVSEIADLSDENMQDIYIAKKLASNRVDNESALTDLQKLTAEPTGWFATARKRIGSLFSKAA